MTPSLNDFEKAFMRVVNAKQKELADAKKKILRDYEVLRGYSYARDVSHWEMGEFALGTMRDYFNFKIDYRSYASHVPPETVPTEHVETLHGKLIHQLPFGHEQFLIRLAMFDGTRKSADDFRQPTWWQRTRALFSGVGA